MLFLIRFATTGECGPLELHSLLSNNSFSFNIEKESTDSDPFEIIECSSKAIDFLCTRSIWFKSVSLLISYGDEDNIMNVCKIYENVYNLENVSSKSFIEQNSLKMYEITDGFKIKPRFYGVRETGIDSSYVIDKFCYLIEDLEVNLRGNSVDIDIVEYEKVDQGLAKLKKCYLSIFYKASARGYLKSFGVKNLEFIGRTSMAIENTILMSNLCDIRPGMIVYDPCVGSGSLLIGAALFGAYVFGSDMDIHEMVGCLVHKTKVRTKLLGTQIKDNFKHLGDKFLGAVQSNISNSPIKFADRILIDMPYGVRISCFDIQGFLKIVNRLAISILPIGGMLGIWIPGSDDIEFTGMKMFARYVQRDLHILRSLHVFVKI